MATSDAINQTIANLQANIAAFQTANQTLFNQLAAAQAQVNAIQAQIVALPGFNDIEIARRTILRLQALANLSLQGLQGQQGQV